MDTYCGGWGILLIGLIECVAVGWVYGQPGFGRCHRFMQDIATMTGRMPWLAWRICWQGTAPLFITIIIIFAWVDYSPITYDDRPYPAWADALGWCMTLTSIIFIPIIAGRKLMYEAEGSLYEVKLSSSTIRFLIG